MRSSFTSKTQWVREAVGCSNRFDAHQCITLRPFVGQVRVQRAVARASAASKCTSTPRETKTRMLRIEQTMKRQARAFPRTLYSVDNKCIQKQIQLFMSIIFASSAQYFTAYKISWKSKLKSTPECDALRTTQQHSYAPTTTRHYFLEHQPLGPSAIKLKPGGTDFVMGNTVILGQRRMAHSTHAHFYQGAFPIGDFVQWALGGLLDP